MAVKRPKGMKEVTDLLNGKGPNDFGWALRQMKQGRAVARNDWENKWQRFEITKKENKNEGCSENDKCLDLIIVKEYPSKYDGEFGGPRQWIMNRHVEDRYKNVLAEDWMIWETPGQPFSDVLAMILEPEQYKAQPGKKFRRKKWAEDVYLYKPNDSDLILGFYGPLEGSKPWSPFPEDLTATDWVEYLGDERPGHD